MTKKVAKRGWSLDKFSHAVKAGCEKAGTKFASSKAEKAYEDGWTVAYTVSQMAAAKAANNHSSKKKAAA